MEMGNMEEEYIQVITTTEKKGDAEKISEILLHKKLVGCIQIIGPIMSTYWWNDKLEKTSEWLCVAKSSRDLFDEIKKAIRKIHSYEIPEIIAIPIVNGDADYLKWLHDELEK